MQRQELASVEPCGHCGCDWEDMGNVLARCSAIDNMDTKSEVSEASSEAKRAGFCHNLCLLIAHGMYTLSITRREMSILLDIPC